MESATTLYGFAYGEDLDTASGRTLGYRLLTPAAPASWGPEVEALARSLQAAPYPEAWPAAELFCSVLLADGQRLVAVARYGLADHTASRRRGGLELVGVVGPGDLSPAHALKVYAWLRQRRAGADDLRRLGGQHTLADVLAEAPAAEEESLPVLPVRAWQGGVLLFAASSAQAPDRALGLLGQAAGGWQWLPLCGPDFPLGACAQRGPVVAWAPETVELAVRLPGPGPAAPAPLSVTGGRLAAALAVLVVLLLAANLWAYLALPSRLGPTRPGPPAEKAADTGRAGPAHQQTAAEEGSREKLAAALYRLLHEDAALELSRDEARLLARYRRLAARDDGLRVADPKGQAAIGLASVLAGRSADRVARLIEVEFRATKGYDPELIHLIAQRVRERLLAEADKGPP
jgi:hypothetical protein